MYLRTISNDIRELFSLRFRHRRKGNWEGKNILRVRDPEKQIPEEKESKWKEKLMARRKGRIRPLLDDKILSGWNALMITACCKAFAAIGDESYRELAIKSMLFLEEKMMGNGIYYFFHSYKEGVSGNRENEDRAGIPAFLDDYAYLDRSLYSIAGGDGGCLPI